MWKPSAKPEFGMSVCTHTRTQKKGPKYRKNHLQKHSTTFEVSYAQAKEYRRI